MLIVRYISFIAVFAIYRAAVARGVARMMDRGNSRARRPRAPVVSRRRGKWDRDEDARRRNGQRRNAEREGKRWLLATERALAESLSPALRSLVNARNADLSVRPPTRRRS